MRSDRVAPVSPNRLFNDIDRHWAKGCIAELAQQGLIKGDTSGQFRPENNITRAEFAALMYWVFPRALPQQKPQSFVDVPSSHWANKTVQWVYQRGLFSGYLDRTFRPNQILTRSQALIVLVKGLNYVLPAFPQPLLEAYFDDATDIPIYAESAIAAATLAGLVVNYPNVRQLRPNAAITRGELAAILCQVFGRSDAAIRPYTTWSSDLEALQSLPAISLRLLKGNARLVKQIQTRLNVLRLYPDQAPIDGNYSPLTEATLIDFCRILELPNRYTYTLDATLAQILLELDPVCFNLERARNRDAVFNDYLQQEKGYGAAKLAFLDKGIYGSPYEAQVKQYPITLIQTINDYRSQPVVQLASQPRGSVRRYSQNQENVNQENVKAAFQPFPLRGVVPAIDQNGLAFLHADIQQACVCLGDFNNGQLTTRWLGRQALANVELWSATKIIPLLNVVSQVNSSFSQADIDHELIRSRRGRGGFKFYDLAVDMVNYKSAIGSSNSLAAMFKQFETPQDLENWLKAMTGNANLVFRGRYGEGAFIQTPELWDQRLQKVVLTGASAGHGGDNSISTYDLTRLIAMLVWHPFLSSQMQLPGAQWHSLESIIRAMGADSARYLDVAIARLGLNTVLTAPVIISKLGFGRSRIRNRTELVYSAFIQFLDPHDCVKSGTNAPKLRAVGMTLIGAKQLGNGDREATELDARMAAEVTELLRRAVTDEW